MLFSVVTITYNRRPLLEKAVRSVLSQQGCELEHIIIDDGSTDDTEAMLLSLNDARLRYFRQAHSGHLSKLRNSGLKEAKGEVIVFLDSDDYFEPGYFNQLLVPYQNKQLISVICNVHLVSEQEKTTLFKPDNLFQHQNDLLRARLNEEFVIYPSSFSFRQSQPPWLFDERMQLGDNSLFLQVLAAGPSGVMMEPLVNIGKHAGNMSTDIADNLQVYPELMQTLLDLKTSHKIGRLLYQRSKANYLYRYGNSLTQINRHREAAQKYRQAFFAFPLHIKALLKFFRAAAS